MTYCGNGKLCYLIGHVMGRCLCLWPLLTSGKPFFGNSPASDRWAKPHAVDVCGLCGKERQRRVICCICVADLGSTSSVRRGDRRNGRAWQDRDGFPPACDAWQASPRPLLGQLACSRIRCPACKASWEGLHSRLRIKVEQQTPLTEAAAPHVSWAMRTTVSVAPTVLLVLNVSAAEAAFLWKTGIWLMWPLSRGRPERVEEGV